MAMWWAQDPDAVACHARAITQIWLDLGALFPIEIRNSTCTTSLKHALNAAQRSRALNASRTLWSARELRGSARDVSYFVPPSAGAKNNGGAKPEEYTNFLPF